MTFGKELVLRGSQERLIPISMTVLTTGLTLVPMIIGGSIPGQEIEYPMTIVILGGLITATLLNLLVVPSLYLQLTTRPLSRQRRTRQLRPMRVLVTTAAALLGLSACAAGATAPDAIAVPHPVIYAPAAASVSAIDSSLCTRVEGSGCVFDHDNFDDPTSIDNE